MPLTVMRMAKELKFFSDGDQLNPITVVDFSRVDVGETHKLTIFMGNMSDEWPIKEITVNKDKVDPQLTIDFAEELEPSEFSPVVITWTPSLDRRIPLDLTGIFEAELWIG